MTQGVDSRIPVTLLTGFLGSGKTTTLNNLLHSAELADTAVIINEFGEVGIDHLLVEEVSENLRLLQSGCLCCTVRGDLVDTLADLYERQRRNEIAPFSRVIIETTGLADPTPVLQTFMIDPQVAPRFRLDLVVTTVDVVNGINTLERHLEAVKQVFLADRLLLTKTDLGDVQSIEAVTTRLQKLNPAAQVIQVVDGRVDVTEVIGGTMRDDALEVDAYVVRTGPEQVESGHHEGSIQSHCLVIDKPIELGRLTYWLELLASLRGENILRVKGIVKTVESPDQPIVVHGVQQVFHASKSLPKWPTSDRRSKIVFIVQGIDFSEIARTFEKFVGVQIPALMLLGQRVSKPSMEKF